ncbi:MAG: hypothetical protein SNJ54_10315 [Anaerolineae bacterium]
MQYKVSYVIGDEETPGIIRTRDTMPRVGDVVHIEGGVYVVQEVMELSRQAPNRMYILAKVNRKPAAAAHA